MLHFDTEPPGNTLYDLTRIVFKQSKQQHNMTVEECKRTKSGIVEHRRRRLNENDMQKLFFLHGCSAWRWWLSVIQYAAYWCGWKLHTLALAAQFLVTSLSLSKLSGIVFHMYALFLNPICSARTMILLLVSIDAINAVDITIRFISCPHSTRTRT